MLILQDATYTHPNRDVLFSHVSLVVPDRARIALIGNNGSGKSTLLNILSGRLSLQKGTLSADTTPYYVPQHFGQFGSLTVAQALGIAEKRNALHEILGGAVTEDNLAALAADWDIEERSREAISRWGLGNIDPDQPMQTLSGGQKTKVFLAGIAIHHPGIVLLDEPSNHLDKQSRALLYEYVRTADSALVVVSHDRELLNLLDLMYELGPGGITAYGGDYDFYLQQKEAEREALEHAIHSKEKLLKKARHTERETLERQQKLDARGKKKQDKAGLPTISMNTLKNNAEKSTARIRGMHAEKIGELSGELEQLRSSKAGTGRMKLGLDNPALHAGKTLIAANGINFGYNGQPLWKKPLAFTVRSGERIAIAGSNGSGKSTLVRLMLGSLQPVEGTISRAEVQAMYIDQDYTLVDSSLTVCEQAMEFNAGGLQEHEVKMRLNRFLFGRGTWNKPCSVLSGGEKMRLVLCALTLGITAPDIIVLDEPTNNLDLHNIGMLTQAVREYKGTLLVISHDTRFLEEILVEREIAL